MLKIVVHVNSPPARIIGIKEQIAMDLERFGDVRVISVEELAPEQPQQLQMGGFGGQAPPPSRNSRNRR